MSDLYQFHFVKLVESIESSDMRTPRAGLSSEARGIAYIFDRQLRFIEDYIPIEISQRNFSCGDQVKVICCGMVHLTFLVRKLTSTISTILVD